MDGEERRSKGKLTECETESALDEVHDALEGADDGAHDQLEEVHDGAQDALDHLEDRLDEVRYSRCEAHCDDVLVFWWCLFDDERQECLIS